MRGFFGGCVVFLGGMCGFLGVVHGFFGGRVCFFSGGMHGFLGGCVRGFFSFFECIGYNKIRSMSRRYTSY